MLDLMSEGCHARSLDDDQERESGGRGEAAAVEQCMSAGALGVKSAVMRNDCDLLDGRGCPSRDAVGVGGTKSYQRKVQPNGCR